MHINKNALNIILSVKIKLNRERLQIARFRINQRVHFARIYSSDSLIHSILAFGIVLSR